MNFFDRLICGLASVFLFFLSLTGLLDIAQVFPDADHPLARGVRSWFFSEGDFGTGVISFSGYLLLFGMGLLLISVAFRRKREPNSIQMETGEGEVEISREVLVELVHRLQDQLEGIREVDPILSDEGNDIHLIVEVGVDSNGDIPNRLQAFKKRLRERLMENFRIKNLDRVTVRIKNLSDPQSSKTTEDIELNSDEYS